jgi:nucleoside-diphosphate-sugar epimerase
MGGKVAFISGGGGVTGRNLAQHLEKCSDWDTIYAVSRRPINFGTDKIKGLSIDLQDKDAVAIGVKGLNVTHVWFCAFQMTESAVRDVEVNFSQMFVNTVEGLEAGGAQLHHVHFVSGTKWYGPHLGPIKTPSREEDPRAMGPNFYYNMEDYCIERRKAGATWSWGSLRPNPVCGFSTGSFMNITMTIAVYAALCKELGYPFRFPGSKTGYDVLLEVVDADLLAEAMVWVATTPEAQDASYNVSNGDVFRWSEVWPKLAAYFDLPLAEPQKFGMTTLMSTQEKEAAWTKLQKEHSLEQIAFKDVATWPFGDWVFGQETDWFSNVSKLRRAGFHQMNIDTAEMFIRQFDQLKKNKIIPA